MDLSEIVNEIARIDSAILSLRQSQIKLGQMFARSKGLDEHLFLSALKRTSDELMKQNEVDW